MVFSCDWCGFVGGDLGRFDESALGKCSGGLCVIDDFRFIVRALSVDQYHTSTRDHRAHDLGVFCDRGFSSIFSDFIEGLRSRDGGKCAIDSKQSGIFDFDRIYCVVDPMDGSSRCLSCLASYPWSIVWPLCDALVDD